MKNATQDEWHSERFEWPGPLTALGLGALLSFGPTLLHHFGDTLACGSAHVTARAPRVGCTTTAYGPSSPAGSSSFKGGQRLINPVALALQISNDACYIHASPFKV